MADLKSSNWIKYTSTDITSDDSAPTEVSASLPSHHLSCTGFRSARIRFYVDSDNATMAGIVVHLVYISTDAISARARGAVNQYHTKALTTLSGTIQGGSVTGVAGGNATAGENYLGLVGTNTVSAWGQKLMNHVNGTIDVHNVDDEIGELLISDLANAHYIHIQFDVNSASLVNAEVHLDV